jgi:hypothetical protein
VDDPIELLLGSRLEYMSKVRFGGAFQSFQAVLARLLVLFGFRAFGNVEADEDALVWITRIKPDLLDGDVAGGVGFDGVSKGDVRASKGDSSQFVRVEDQQVTDIWERRAKRRRHHRPLANERRTGEEGKVNDRRNVI